MKKLLLLGGSSYIVPVIQKAHELGLYVITCDYLPNNIAHRFSDEYLNISIIDKEAVLRAAQDRKISGVMSFACDPGVSTAAFVAEKMGLPFQGSYRSTSILQDKGLFRAFLKDNGFNCPIARRYEDRDSPFNDLELFNWPVIVKPADSAGSKSITKVNKVEELPEAIESALEGAHNGAFIIEEYLTFEGYHSSSDLFTIDGKLVFTTFSDHLFDTEAENPYTPICTIWPSTMKEEYQNKLTSEIQRLMTLLEMKTGIYNVETCVSNGKPYIMEVSPRGGGCKIAEIQKLAFGVDLIEAEIRNAVGLSLCEITSKECDGFWCELVVHALPGQSGILKSITVDSEIKEKYLRLVDLSVKEGDMVMPFTGANMALGTMFFCFESREQLDDVISRYKQWIHIELQ